MRKAMIVLFLILCTTTLCACFFSPNKIDIGADFTGGINMPNLTKEEQLGDRTLTEIDLNEKNIASVLHEITRPSGYIWENKVTYYSGNTTRTLTNKIYAKGDKVKLESYHNNSLVGLYMIMNGTLYSFDNSTVYYYERPYSLASTGYDSLLSIGNIGDFYPIDQTAIVESRLESMDTGNVLYFTVKDDTLKLEDTYEFSMDTGTPLRVESKINGVKSYEFVTTSFELIAPDDAYFALNPLAKKME